MKAMDCKTKLFFVLTIIISFSISTSLPTTKDKEEDQNGILEINPNEDTYYQRWLNDFGYVSEPDSYVGTLNKHSPEISPVAKLQRFAGLPETGILDDETKNLMKASRCGLSDFSSTGNSRKKRYVLQGTFWKSKDITWKLINNNDDGLSRQLIEQILERAFNRWAVYTTLKFTKVKDDNADIRISFRRKKHGDSNPFDGKGKVLAHAFFPDKNEGLAGDVHFDDDEEFTHNSKKGRNLYWIAIHEIGHSLGLEHTSVKEAVMHPWYPGYQGKEVFLSTDDIQGIQALYGSPSSSTGNKNSLNSKSHKTCVRKIKSIFLGKDLLTFIINKDKLYIFSKELYIRQGPLPVDSYFEGVQYVDAAYKRLDGKIVLFSGRHLYVFDDKKRISGPTLISRHYKGFPSGIKRIDAALVWTGNGRTYLFAGEKYWRYNNFKKRIDYGYPRSIKNVMGLPSNLDAAFSWNDGKTYIFKGRKYYQLRKSRMSVAHGFPKDISKEWMPCSSEIKDMDERNGSNALMSPAVIIITVSIISLFLSI